MERTQKLALLKEWEDNYKEINKVYESLHEMYDCSPESKAVRVIFDTFENYTKSVAIIIEDEDDWLEWYLYDNECGKKELTAKAITWKNHKKIKNVKDLLDIIESV